MIHIALAGLTVCLENRYDYTTAICRDYLAPEGQRPDITVAVSEEELHREIGEMPQLFFSEGYAESIALYERLSCRLPAFDGFVMHSSAVAVDGAAYCFAAASGVGKSTHTRYWRELLGDRVTIINGDKPIYRFLDNELLACGTPWCGKEGWQSPICVPLRGLCLLERGEENVIYPVDGFAHLRELIRQFYLPGGQVDTPRVMELIDAMLEKVPVYRLRVRNERAAAEMAAALLLGEEFG